MINKEKMKIKYVFIIYEQKTLDDNVTVIQSFKNLDCKTHTTKKINKNIMNLKLDCNIINKDDFDIYYCDRSGYSNYDKKRFSNIYNFYHTVITNITMGIKDKSNTKLLVEVLNAIKNLRRGRKK